MLVITENILSPFYFFMDLASRARSRIFNPTPPSHTHTHTHTHTRPNFL